MLKAELLEEHTLRDRTLRNRMAHQVRGLGFSEAQLQELQDHAVRTATVPKLESSQGKKLYGPMQEQVQAQRAITEGLEARGILQRGEHLVPRGRILPREPVAMPAPSALAAMAAEKGGTEAAVGRLARQVTKAPLTGTAKFLGGGAAAMLLLPLLSRIMGGGRAAPEMPLSMQIQMAQMMAKMKQDEALTQSLVSARGASAEKDLARAELLRLQALQAGGGGAGVLI